MVSKLKGMEIFGVHINDKIFPIIFFSSVHSLLFLGTPFFVLLFRNLFNKESSSDYLGIAGNTQLESAVCYIL